jgi:uncharacterized protein (DUF1778 family)
MANSITHQDRRQREPARQDRLETRVTAEEKELLQRAAYLEHRSVTEFVRSSARAAAEETIRRHEMMTLSARESAAFVESLLNPPTPGERLRDAAQAHRELLGG